MVTSELTGEVSMGVLLVFLVFWRRRRYIVPDQQGDGPRHIISVFRCRQLTARAWAMLQDKWGMLYGTVMSSAKKNYDVIFLLERII